MSNMSYCRFQNTFLDLRDCDDACKDGTELSEMSNREQQAFIDLIMLAKEIAEHWEDFDECELKEYIELKQNTDSYE